jgi:hypothetical protein
MKMRQKIVPPDPRFDCSWHILIILDGTGHSIIFEVGETYVSEASESQGPKNFAK